MFSLVRLLIVICFLLSFGFLTACGGGSSTRPSAQAPRSAVSKNQASQTAKSSSPTGKSTAQSNTKSNSGAGGYYLDDGPGDNAPADIDNIPDAPLKAEVPLVRANKPYMALGQQYVPMTSYVPYKKQGVASWYGKRYHGKPTSTGEIYDMYAMSGAHTILPIPSYAKVTNLSNGRSVIVRINDRGPFKHDRLIDLSYAAAYKLRLTSQGSGLVEVEAIDTSAEAIQKISTAQASIPTVNTTPINPTAGVASPPTNNSISLQYYVQVGAFKNEINANALQKRIEGFDLAENVGIASVYNNGLFRVKLGPYMSKQDADTSAANIRKQLSITAIVIN